MGQGHQTVRNKQYGLRSQRADNSGKKHGGLYLAVGILKADGDGLIGIVPTHPVAPGATNTVSGVSPLSEFLFIR